MTDRERFDRLIVKVLEHEGGLSDHPDDPGGLTHWGISLRSYLHLGREGIRNLAKETAADIYCRDWWGPLTLAAADAADVAELLSLTRLEQANYYRACAWREPKLKVFERGWMARASS